MISVFAATSSAGSGPDLWGWLVSAAAGGILVKLIDMIGSRGVNSASIAEKANRIALETLQVVKEEAEALKGEVQKLRREVSELRIIASVFEDEVVALGGDPIRLVIEARKRLLNE